MGGHRVKLQFNLEKSALRDRRVNGAQWNLGKCQESSELAVEFCLKGKDSNRLGRWMDRENGTGWHPGNTVGWEQPPAQDGRRSRQRQGSGCLMESMGGCSGQSYANPD